MTRIALTKSDKARVIIATKTYFTSTAPDGVTTKTRASREDYGYTAAGWRQNLKGEWDCVTFSRSAANIQRAGWSDITIQPVSKSDKKPKK